MHDLMFLVNFLRITLIGLLSRNGYVVVEQTKTAQINSVKYPRLFQVRSHKKNKEYNNNFEFQIPELSHLKKICV